MPTSVPPHAYAGARAMVLLHAEHLPAFVRVWRRAQASSLSLPATTDPSGTPRTSYAPEASLVACGPSPMPQRDSEAGATVIVALVTAAPSPFVTVPWTTPPAARRIRPTSTVAPAANFTAGAAVVA